MNVYTRCQTRCNSYEEDLTFEPADKRHYKIIHSTCPEEKKWSVLFVVTFDYNNHIIFSCREEFKEIIDVIRNFWTGWQTVKCQPKISTVFVLKRTWPNHNALRAFGIFQITWLSNAWYWIEFHSVRLLPGSLFVNMTHFHPGKKSGHRLHQYCVKRERAHLKTELNGVYMMPDRVSFRYGFVSVPYWVSIFVYMIPTKISFQNESLQNGSHTESEFPFRFETGRAFHKYRVHICKGGTSSFRYEIRQVD